MDGGASEAAREAFRRSLAGIVLPKAFAARRVEGRLASIAYGVLHRGFLGLEAVGTEPQAQRQGHARHVLAGLMDWAGGQGGERACLSVLAENAPALALYRSLGFTRDVYRYHYRRND
ncbi:hypothetical protein GCM10011390_13000 [Aureimonas endophytica]|uniref:N-acetyltransferase domain-containing protein n=1 Tax=Aureimonas endophytica TaxID=2027858 RepID=A0A917E286_9HYPH|nr:GNAT family N-acetyltransferase [Aureimonas endophytica]GGD95649.1 hypothetical protein GCM10011390_13000 [Aureimonas endophytica]